jgi:hypothetical protein
MLSKKRENEDEMEDLRQSGKKSLYLWREIE